MLLLLHGTFIITGKTISGTSLFVLNTLKLTLNNKLYVPFNNLVLLVMRGEW